MMEWVAQTINIVCLIYAALPVLFLLSLLVYYFTGGSMEQATWDKIMDFGKWYLVTVALVVSTSLVKDGITERETGVREMESFQKYTDIITEKGGIEKRWELCNYFANVTPTRRLRDGWKAYQKSIKSDYDQFLSLPKKEDSIRKSPASEQAKLALYAQIGEERAALSAPLVVRQAATEDAEWVIIFTTDDSLPKALDELKKQRSIVPGVRLFHKERLYFCTSGSYPTRAEAQAVLNLIAARFTSSPRVINLVNICKTPVFNGQYYECN